MKARMLFLILLKLPYIMYYYFVYLIRYSNHPEKYPFELRYKRIKKFAISLIKTMKVDIKVENKELVKAPIKPFLGISNHRHLIDPLFYIVTNESPVSFVSKKEVENFPVLGRCMKAFDCYFIEREDLIGQVKLFKDIANRLKKGDVSYYIFTEGTRNKVPDPVTLLPYKDGTLKAAYWSDSDIIYSVILGSEQVFNKKPKDMKKRVVKINFIEHLNFEDIKDKKTTDVMPVIEKKSKEVIIEISKDMSYYKN